MYHDNVYREYKKNKNKIIIYDNVWCNPHFSSAQELNNMNYNISAASKKDNNQNEITKRNYFPGRLKSLNGNVHATDMWLYSQNY